MGSSAHCSLIYFWVPSSCFCIVISLSPEGEIIPFSGVCQSRGGCIIHAGGGGGFTHWLTNYLWCATDDDQRQHHHAEHIIFSFSIQLTPSCILHRAQQHHADASLHVSNCRVRQLQFSGIFVALGFVGNGVITVMINSPCRQTMMQITRVEIIAVTLLIHQSLWPFQPLLWILQSGCQPYARTESHNQRPAWAWMLLQRSIAWRISPRSIIGKAPRSLICCNATASWLSERSLSGQAACGRHPTNGKKLVVNLLIWVWV